MATNYTTQLLDAGVPRASFGKEGKDLFVIEKIVDLATVGTALTTGDSIDILDMPANVAVVAATCTVSRLCVTATALTAAVRLGSTALTTALDTGASATLGASVVGVSAALTGAVSAAAAKLNLLMGTITGTIPNAAGNPKVKISLVCLDIS